MIARQLKKVLVDLNIEWEAGTNTVRGYNNQEQSVNEIVIRQNNNH